MLIFITSKQFENLFNAKIYKQNIASVSISEIG